MHYFYWKNNIGKLHCVLERSGLCHFKTHNLILPNTVTFESSHTVQLSYVIFSIKIMHWGYWCIYYRFIRKEHCENSNFQNLVHNLKINILFSFKWLCGQVYQLFDLPDKLMGKSDYTLPFSCMLWCCVGIPLSCQIVVTYRYLISTIIYKQVNSSLRLIHTGEVIIHVFNWNTLSVTGHWWDNSYRKKIHVVAF